MRQRVGAIIFSGNSIILLKRVVKDRIYWVFPGGEIDPGETKEEAMVRECKEELGVDVKIVKPFAEISHKPYGKSQKEYFFICEIIAGEPGTGDGPEFSGDPKYWYRGSYEVVKVPKEKIIEINLLPEEIKSRVLTDSIK